MATENLGTFTTTTTAVPAVAAGNPITQATFQQMLGVLNELVSHTHVFYDDYTTACDCNCNCNCGRGIV